MNTDRPVQRVTVSVSLFRGKHNLSTTLNNTLWDVTYAAIYIILNYYTYMKHKGRFLDRVLLTTNIEQFNNW